MLTLNDGRSELWQWDTGRKLTVDADCTQVHFSNKFFGRSVDVDVFDGTAEIPDVLLQVDKDLLVWAFVGTAENGYTKISKVFKVNKRNKPADYVFTPTEQTTLDEIMKRLDRIEEGQDPDAIKNAVDEYIDNNPIQVEEKDPTVPEWAKKETKPSYSKSEVGLGDVDNVRQYSASNPPPYPVVSVNGQTGKVQLGAADVGARPSNWMPTAQEVGALPDTYVPPDQTAAQVGADPAGTAAAAVSAHNTSTDAHNDLRLELKAINDRLNAFFDSDDKTLDELSEIVAYITSNKSLIDAITTSKVSVADIVNNLTTNVANKPLSAAQGVVLKGLIDGLSSGKLDANKLTDAINTALAQAKASGEFDGVSATHSWDGTVLTMTSASGTSSADLKGKPGKDGADGNTSVKVVTKAEYSALTAESVKKLYSDGIRLIIVEDESVNLVPSAVSANGGIYNGCGYMNGIRLNSSGEIVTSRQSCVTGFIPFTYGQKLSVYGSKGPLGTPGQYVAAYNDAFVRLGVTYMESLSGITATADEDNIYTFTANTTQTMFNGASYIRISLNPCEGRDIVVQLGGDAE